MGEAQEKAAQAPSQARSWACLHNSARSAATTAAGRGCAHTAAELQRGGAPHPPTGVWPHASDAVAVDMQRSAGCSTVQCRLRHHASAGCSAVQFRLRSLQPHARQVLVAEYIKGNSGISPARATVPLVEMERRARARAAEEAAAERQQQAMLTSLAASEAQQAPLTMATLAMAIPTMALPTASEAQQVAPMRSLHLLVLTVTAYITKV